MQVTLNCCINHLMLSHWLYVDLHLAALLFDNVQNNALNIHRQCKGTMLHNNNCAVNVVN